MSAICAVSAMYKARNFFMGDFPLSDAQMQARVA